MFTSSTSNTAQSRNTPTHRYTASVRGKVAEFFNLKQENNVTFFNEILGGISMYLCSVYMLNAGPDSQSSCAMFNTTSSLHGSLNFSNTDKEQFASSYAAVMGISTIIVGLGANAPYVIGPGIAFGRSFGCMSSVVTVSQALAANFIVGWILFALVLISRQIRVLQSIPEDLRLGLGAGIGALLCAITLGSIGTPATVDVPVLHVDRDHLVLASGAFVPVIGFVLVTVLFANDTTRRFSIVGSVLLTAFVVWMIKLGENSSDLTILDQVTIPGYPRTYVPSFSWSDDNATSMVFKYVVLMVIEKVFNILSVVTSLILLQVCHRIGYKRETFVEILNDSSKISRIYMADVFCNIFVAPFLGTAIVTPYIESTASLIVGAKSGLASVVCGCLFLLTIPIATSTAMVLGLSASSCTIAFVCFFIVQQVRFISYKHVVDFAPAYLVFFMVPIFGIGFGATVSYLCMFFATVVSGRFSKIEPVMLIMAAYSAMYVILLFEEESSQDAAVSYVASVFSVLTVVGGASAWGLSRYRKQRQLQKYCCGWKDMPVLPPPLSAGTTTTGLLGTGSRKSQSSKHEHRSFFASNSRGGGEGGSSFEDGGGGGGGGGSEGAVVAPVTKVTVPVHTAPFIAQSSGLSTTFTDPMPVNAEFDLVNSGEFVSSATDPIPSPPPPPSIITATAATPSSSSVHNNNVVKEVSEQDLAMI